MNEKILITFWANQQILYITVNTIFNLIRKIKMRRKYIYIYIYIYMQLKLAKHLTANNNWHLETTVNVIQQLLCSAWELIL